MLPPTHRRLAALRSAVSSSPSPVPAAHEPLMPPFSRTYAEARAALHSHCQRLGGALTRYIHPLKGPDNEELSIDVVTLGALDVSRSLVCLLPRPSTRLPLCACALPTPCS